jgi:hypothetical protein
LQFRQGTQESENDIEQSRAVPNTAWLFHYTVKRLASLGSNQAFDGAIDLKETE